MGPPAGQEVEMGWGPSRSPLPSVKVSPGGGGEGPFFHTVPVSSGRQ